MKTVVSFSGGKDSTAMLLRMLELDQDVGKIVFADTLFEFPELYEYIKRVEKYIGRNITILKPKTRKLQLYLNEQLELIYKLKEKGIISDIPKYNESWTKGSEINEFQEWFYGIVTRGENVGKQRGFPLRAFPCWWTRESKVKPLSNFQKDVDLVYIGIAYDEKERMSKVDGNLRYPLVDWKWTEQDCINYLNKKNMFNPLYVNFDRLGCWICPKQGEKSLYVLWKNYPGLWKEYLWWDNENYRIKGTWIKEKSLLEIGREFEKGKKPNKLPKYECWNGCESVKRAFQAKQCGLGLFIDVENEEKNSSKS